MLVDSPVSRVCYEIQDIFVVCITELIIEIRSVYHGFPQAQDLDMTHCHTVPAREGSISASDAISAS